MKILNLLGVISLEKVIKLVQNALTEQRNFPPIDYSQYGLYMRFPQCQSFPNKVPQWRPPQRERSYQSTPCICHITYQQTPLSVFPPYRA